MNDKLISLIKYGSENHALDFKEVEYSLEQQGNKNEILKDISAMANHPSDEDKYIIVGVKDGNSIEKTFRGLGKLTDEAKYQQFINSNIEPAINFEYKGFNYDGLQLAFFRIYSNTNRPYLFKKELSNPTKQED